MADCEQCFYGSMVSCSRNNGPLQYSWRCRDSLNDPATCADCVPRGTPRALLPVPSWHAWRKCPACGTLRKYRSTRTYTYLECPACGHRTRTRNGPSGNPRNYASCHYGGISPATGRRCR